MSKAKNKIYQIAKQRASEELNKKANQIADDVKEMARSSIQEWYDAYYPRSYRRTYATFAGSTRVCEIGETSAVAGVRIDPGQVPDTYYHDPPSYVFPRSFDLGIHGTIDTGGQTTSPREILNKKFNAYKASL